MDLASAIRRRSEVNSSARIVALDLDGVSCLEEPAFSMRGRSHAHAVDSHGAPARITRHSQVPRRGPLGLPRLHVSVEYGRWMHAWARLGSRDQAQAPAGLSSSFALGIAFGVPTALLLLYLLGAHRLAIELDGRPLGE